MSSSEQRANTSVVGTRSEAVDSPPIEVIEPISHPSYSNNVYPTAIKNLLFPIHSRSNSDLLLSQPLLPHAVPAQFKSWPRSKKPAASVGKSVEPSSAAAKAEKRKVQRSSGRQYSTRSSSRLVSNFSNTDDDPMDLVSSPPISGDGNGVDLSSRLARLQQHEGPAYDVYLSFTDVGTSTPSQLAKSFPSAESLFYARTAVRKFLDLGLHQLGESQRLAMISAVSILRASPEFSTEHLLLDSIGTIFSDSDAAQAKSTSLMAKLEDFHKKRRQAEVMEQENLSVRTQIKKFTVEYDANKGEVKNLEEKILEHRTKMALLLDEAESLEKKLLSNKCETKAVVDELVSLKEDYGTWMREMQDSKDRQGDCLLKCQQLRRLFCLSSWLSMFWLLIMGLKHFVPVFLTCEI
ncbi:hypothetical protein F511_35139 [Dorcoceras hygrometricum]|uniref:Uncharacterized protein n=1 Tax=Dorcoceras hygrometricum TaxID=472368 RepID=A0A2Z7CJF7_9LAMI|nr:hypothetical protein F511_35139 [Dorcoceras hygrometricum]